MSNPAWHCASPVSPVTDSVCRSTPQAVDQVECGLDCWEITEATGTVGIVANPPTNSACIKAGDFLIIFVGETSTNQTNDNQWRPPKGWTRLVESRENQAGATGFWKIADGTEGSSTVFITPANTDWIQPQQIITYYGSIKRVDQTNPISGGRVQNSFTALSTVQTLLGPETITDLSRVFAFNVLKGNVGQEITVSGAGWKQHSTTSMPGVTFGPVATLAIKAPGARGVLADCVFTSDEGGSGRQSATFGLVLNPVNFNDAGYTGPLVAGMTKTVREKDTTDFTLQSPGGDEVTYTPDMMTYDGSTGYYDNQSSTTSGNQLTVVGRFTNNSFTGDVVEYICRVIGVNSEVRVSVLAVSSDYSTLANRRDRLQFFVTDTAGTALALIFSSNTHLDGAKHTFMFSYDGTAGTVQLIVDGVDDDDTGNGDRVLTTGTVEAGLGTVGIGASSSGAAFWGGSIGFFGYRDAYLTNWSDFMESDGTPKQIVDSGVYSANMMRFDGTTGYYSDPSITTSGNALTVVGRFKISTFTTDIIKYICRIVGSSSQVRLSVLAVSSDYSSLANRRSRIQFSVTNSSGTQLALIFSSNTHLDDEYHTFLFSYDGTAGTATLIVDEVDDDDTGNADRVLITGTVEDGVGSIGVGATESGASFWDGEIGYFGYSDIYLTNGSDFMDGSEPTGIDEYAWTEWGGEPLFWAADGNMRQTTGSVTGAEITENGTITKVLVGAPSGWTGWGAEPLFWNDDGFMDTNLGYGGEMDRNGTITQVPNPAIVANDLLVIGVACDNKQAVGVLTAPSGWTEAIEAGSVSTDTKAAIYYKVAAGGDTDATVVSSIAVGWTGWYARITGAATSTPLDSTGSFLEEGLPAVPTSGTNAYTTAHPTTTTADCIAMAISAYQGSDASPGIFLGDQWVTADTGRSHATPDGVEGSVAATGTTAAVAFAKIPTIAGGGPLNHTFTDITAQARSSTYVTAAFKKA